MGLDLIPSGDGEIRTLDPLLARQVLSQLSYTPMDAGLPSFQRRSLMHLCSVFISISQSLVALPFRVMGLSGLEPPTSRLSGVRSNRLSYKPIGIRHPPALPCRLQHSTIGRLGLNRRVRDGNGCVPQPHRHQNSSEPLSEIQQYIKPLLLHSVLVGLIQLHSATYL